MTSDSFAWDSDAAAVEALKQPLGPAAVKIRCTGPRSGRSCGTLLGEVTETWQGDVLTVYYWAPGEERSARNRRKLVTFLDDSGDVGMYSCRYHGHWRADLDAVRTTVIEGAMTGQPRVSLSVSPPTKSTKGRMAP